MSKPVQWLLAEIEAWTAEKLITPTQAAALRSRYAGSAADSSLPWGLVVFSCAGATVLGLGIILLIAYNWDALPKAAKLALVFGAVAGCHASGFVLLQRDGWKRTIGEAVSLLGSMFFGAGIWLVAQVYHLNEHYPDGFLFWGAGTLLLAWALRSIQQASLATLLFATWGCSETWGFQVPAYWATLVIVAGIGPLAWRARSSLLATLILFSVYTLSFSTVLRLGGGPYSFTFTFAFATLLLAAARLLERPAEDYAALVPVLRFFGLTSFLACCYLLSFHQMGDDLLDWERYRGHAPVATTAYSWVCFALGLAAWACLTWQAGTKRRTVPVEEWLYPIALGYIFLLASTGVFREERLVASVFNLVLLGLAVMWMLRGCRLAQIIPTVIGSVVLALLVIARYFDLFESLAARGVTFVILGGVLFAEAIYFHRVRRQRAPGETAP